MFVIPAEAQLVMLTFERTGAAYNFEYFKIGLSNYSYLFDAPKVMALCESKILTDLIASDKPLLSLS